LIYIAPESTNKSGWTTPQSPNWGCYQTLFDFLIRKTLLKDSNFSFLSLLAYTVHITMRYINSWLILPWTYLLLHLPTSLTVLII